MAIPVLFSEQLLLIALPGSRADIVCLVVGVSVGELGKKFDVGDQPVFMDRGMAGGAYGTHHQPGKLLVTDPTELTLKY